MADFNFKNSIYGYLLFPKLKNFCALESDIFGKKLNTLSFLLVFIFGYMY